jgi:hypothetical protein
MGDCTAAVARQQPDSKRRIVFSALFAEQRLNNNRGTMFSVQSMPRCYKHHNWSNGLVVEQSPFGKNVTTETEDIVGISHQATKSEATAG